MFPKSNVDPELEKLRKEVDGPPNLDTVVLNIERATAQIHAGFLFDHIGITTLQKLCMLLSSTHTGKPYCGWQEFASYMGLTMEQIRCIDYEFKGSEDPTYYALVSYVQKKEATIDKIFNALQKMQRFDIINQIKDDVSKLVAAIPHNNVDGSFIFRPKSIPRAPLVLIPKENVRRLQRETIDPVEISKDSLKTTKQSYGCTVMLTFTDDGLKTAQNITKIFRSKEPKIGVLILHEQENHVYSRAEGFIDDCFRQVNYIVPILTQGYIERIKNSEDIYAEHQNKLDSKYVKYIYTLFRNEYFQNESKNYRVRCIIPDKEKYAILKEYLHPVLNAWYTESCIHEFVENILLQRYSR